MTEQHSLTDKNKYAYSKWLRECVPTLREVLRLVLSYSYSFGFFFVFLCMCTCCFFWQFVYVYVFAYACFICFSACFRLLLCVCVCGPTRITSPTFWGIFFNSGRQANIQAALQTILFICSSYKLPNTLMR